MFRSVLFLVVILSSVLLAVDGDMGVSKGANGTEEHPWLIEDFTDFQTFCNNSSYLASFTYINLECDLDLDPSLENRQIYSHSPIAPSSTFSGCFDGQNHIISNLNITSYDSHCALFGMTSSNASITNLFIENVNISNNDWDVAALVGYNSGAIINCYSTGEILGKTRVGGLVGDNSSGSIIACYSRCTVSGESNIGGLVGYSQGSIADCYSCGVVSGIENIAGLVGYNRNSITNCYSACITKGFGGGLIGYNDSGVVSKCFFYAYGGPDNGYGTPLDDQQLLEQSQFKGFDFVNNSIDGTDDNWAIESGYMPRLSWQDSSGYEPPYYFTTISTILNGEGTINSPFEINNKNDLMEFRSNSKLRYGYYILNDNIDISDIPLTGAFIPEPFSGHFDGNNKKISNLTIDVNDEYSGFFCQIYGSVTSLELPNVAVIGSYKDYSASLSGYNAGLVDNCFSSGVIQVPGGQRAGGLLAWNSGVVSDSDSSCLVTSHSSVGGLVGLNAGSIIRCTAEGIISGTGNGVGGLIGSNSGNIDCCFVENFVNGSYDIGNLVGINSGNINDSFSVGQVYSDGYRTGGIAGNNYGNINNSYSTSLISGGNDLGGIVGRNESGSVTNSYYYIYGMPNNGFGIALDDEQLLDKESFIGFDFVGDISDCAEDVWTIESGYMPRLSWQPSPGYEPPYILDKIETTLSGYGSTNDPFVIANKTDLLEFRNNSSLRIGNYILMNDIDLNGDIYPEAFIPQDFTGNFRGNNHSILNLSIEGDANLGFFSELAGNISDLSLKNVYINGRGDFIGGLVGEVTSGSIANSNSTGVVNGKQSVGGLVGKNSGSLTNCNSLVAVNGTSSYVGGLVGYNSGGTIGQCFCSGNVVGYGYYTGGFVGLNYDSLITESFSSGNVLAEDDAGGFCGANDQYSGIFNCYAIGAIEGGNYIGGFCGDASGCGVILNCYSTGSVIGESTSNSGFCGCLGSGAITNCFWDTETSSQIGSNGGSGLVTNTMQTQQPYLNTYWDFFDETANGIDDIWFIAPGEYPKLMWQVDISSQPAGDFYNAPIPVSCGVKYEGANIGAFGLDMTTYGYNDYSDIWCKFETLTKGSYDIDLFESDFDTTLSVFDQNQTEIVFNDDYEGSAQSKVTLKAKENTIYYIRISGYNYSEGTYNLFISNPNHSPADFNSDNYVDLCDFSAVSSSWLERYTFNDLTDLANYWLE